MKITSILDITPELASDIQYLWDESDLTSEEIAEVVQPDRERMELVSVPLEIVWDILGGAYVYDDN